MDERAKRISKAIESCGYSYPELSKITGISKSSLQRYATGETKKIPIDCIEKIANATGTSAKYLMGWEENNTTNVKASIPCTPTKHKDRNDIMNIATKLKVERTKSGLSQKEMAEMLNMPLRTYGAYERGERDVSTAVLLNICKALNVSSDYMLDVDVQENQCKADKINEANLSETLDSKKIRLIPVFESVSAGFGARADERVIDYLPLFIEHDYDAENTLAIKVKGDSMYPKIEDGDIVAVRKQSDFENGNIVVILVDNDEGLVKKIYQDSDKVRLVSINPEYPDKIFKGEEICRLRVVGVVKQIIKNV